MSALDWWVLALTQLGIVVYGLYMNRRDAGTQDYLRGRNMGWFTVGLSIMATQASAITFLSAPGLAYMEGMRFVQFYFGLPLAMILIAAVAVPLYYRLNVITAYEYLEHRFDVRLRTLAAFLFLTQRGLAAGLTIFAPALILSAVLRVDLSLTCVVIGGIVVGYTLTGGTTAVARTQKTQMGIILAAMLWAAWLVVDGLPPGVGMGQALDLAEAMGRMDAVDWRFDWNEKYTVWSGLLGGTFLMLSYFGTDQSQVQRYLGGQSIRESRMGLLMNGILKIPMQYGILLVGVLVFVFYLFQPAPLLFNSQLRTELLQGKSAGRLIELEGQYGRALEVRKAAAGEYLRWRGNGAGEQILGAAAEGQRQAAEGQLQGAEGQRQVAEGQRQGAEGQLQAVEGQRQVAEGQLQGAEGKFKRQRVNYGGWKGNDRRRSASTGHNRRLTPCGAMRLRWLARNCLAATRATPIISFSITYLSACRPELLV